MPILTKPAIINKNVAASLTLDKALLKVHASITDSYYQDDANWSKVVFNYRNSFGQREAVIFDASQPTPTKDFLVSDKARSSDFQLQSISIIDYDGGKFKMRRSAIATIVAIADISFESVNTLPAGVTSLLHTYDFSSSLLTISGVSAGEIQNNFTFPFDPSGAYTIRVTCDSNTLSGTVAPTTKLVATFHNSLYGYPNTFADAQNMVAGQMYMAKFVSGWTTGGPFKLAWDYTNGFTGELKISKVEIFQGWHT